MADKAFAHLFMPLLQAETELANRAYIELTEDVLGLSLDQISGLIKCKLVKYVEEADFIIEIIDDGGNSITVKAHEQRSENSPMYISSLTHPQELVSSELYKEAAKLNAKIKKLKDKHEELRGELEEQIGGRSSKEVCAEWPEAAHIIIEVMELDRPEIVKPLEVIMSKHLPALSAPK